MPRILRNGLPKALLDHLSIRVLERKVSLEDLILIAQWLDAEPIAPEGKSFKSFGSFTLCGEGESVKTVLAAGQVPTGTEMK